MKARSVHRFPERHPEGLLIETGNYATSNPLPDHAVFASVSDTPVSREGRRTNLVQQAPNPLRGIGINNTPQILQQILIFLRFLREGFDLSVMREYSVSMLARD